MTLVIWLCCLYDAQQIHSAHSRMLSHVFFQSVFCLGSQRIPHTRTLSKALCALLGVYWRDKVRVAGTKKHQAPPATRELSTLGAAVAPQKHFVSALARIPLMPNGYSMLQMESGCPLFLRRQECLFLFRLLLLRRPTDRFGQRVVSFSYSCCLRSRLCLRRPYNLTLASSTTLHGWKLGCECSPYACQVFGANWRQDKDEDSSAPAHTGHMTLRTCTLHWR